MTDLESLLREEFGQPAGYVRESVDDLIASTRRTRRRRDIGAASGAVAAVVAVVALVVALGQAGTHRPQPAKPPKIDRSTAEALLGTLLKSGIPEDGLFGGDGHGVVSMFACPNGAQANCRSSIARTVDGGATFAPVRMPVTMSDESQMYYFDAEHIVIDEQLGDTAGRPARWVTSDGGTSWKAVSVAAGSPVPVIPQGDRLLDISDALVPGNQDRVGVIGPDGVIHPLSTAPKGSTGPPNGSGRAFAGSYFLSSDSNHVWVTTDNGASWHVTYIPPKGGTEGHFFEVFGADGDRIFAGVESSFATTLERSDDRGLTWVKVDWPAPGAFPPASPGADDGFLAGSSGRSLGVLDGVGAFATNGARMWVMRGGSDVFVPDDAFQPVVLASFGGVLIGIGEDAVHPSFSVSTDGVHWIRATITK